LARCVPAISKGFGPFKPGTVREQLTAFDPQSRTLAYVAIDGLPPFAGRAVNHFSVQALSDTRCAVRSYATLELRGPMRIFGWLVRRRLERVGSQVLAELAYFVEHGRPHARKLQSTNPTYSGSSFDVATRPFTR
jgi:hypothetical protein